MRATRGKLKLEKVHTCVENHLQRRRRRDALGAVDASRWFRPAQVQTRLGRYLGGKHIFLKTGMYGLRVTKHYKVMEYDLDARKYTVIDWDVDGPIEYIEILDEKNIEVYVEVIPVEESSEEEEEEESVPFTLEGLKQMSRDKLHKECFKYKLATGKVSDCKWTKKECIEALMKKFGLEGSALTDTQQKVEEKRKATAAFFQLPIVVAIISTISNFNPKNPRHAELFMKEYRKKEGKGTARSRK